MTMCPISKTAPDGKRYVGTKNRQLLCSPSEIAGTEVVRASLMLLRSMSKATFVKNAYFDGPG